MRKFCRVIIMILLVFSLLQFSLEDHAANASDIIKDNGPVGGPGGRYFRDRIPSQSRVSEIKIRAGKYIDFVQFIHQKDNGNEIFLDEHGGPGGKPYSFKMKNGEYIIRISGKYGRFVDSIRIHTNFRTSHRYGGGGGSLEYSLKAGANMEIVGFIGREGTLIDAIGILYRPKR